MENVFSIEQKAIDILSSYDGGNNFILRLKQQHLVNKKFFPTRTQSDYIITYHNEKPKVAKKWVELDPYFARKFADEKLFREVPDKIYVEKLLVEKEKSYHIWGKFFESEHLSDFWVPKGALIKTHTVEKVDIDYSKYSHRPPLSHQKEAIEKLAGSKRFILADDMGLGKTTSTIIAALESGAKKILIICPASLKINWSREIENYTDKSIYICEGKNFSSDHDFVIVNYDIIKNFHDIKDKETSQIINSKFDLVVLDECFTYDTKIMTEFGEKNIGDIVENGMEVKILTYNHKEKKLEYKNINRWIRKNKDTIYKIKLNNGLFIECTDNHKFYVNNKGYVRAKELTTTDDLYMLSKTTHKETDLEEGGILFEELRVDNKEQNITTETKRIEVSQKLPGMWKFDEFHNRDEDERENVLFCKMFGHSKIKQFRGKKEKKRNNRKEWGMVKGYEKNPRRKPSYGKIVFSKNEEKQSYEKLRKQRKNEKKINRENILIQRRKWKNNPTTRNYFQSVRGWVGNGISNFNLRRKNIIQKFTPILQSGYRKSDFENLYRNRWEISQNKKMEIFGFKEREGIEFVRVESIEILERGSYDESTNVYSKNTRVYDLEIEDNHNYFANSILVSNCHYIKNTQAQRTKLINNFVKNVERLWLLTGTPITSRPIDYYNLLSLVESPVAQNWMAYVIRFCEGYQFRAGQRKVWNVNGASNLDELRERTSKQILRRLKTDVLDLPEKIINPIYLRLKSREYENLMGEYFDWFRNNKEESSSLTVQFSKLMKVRQVIAEEKVSQTIELAENILEQGKKVIIFSNFTEPLKRIHEHFGKMSVYLDGSTTKPARQKAVDDFQDNDKVKVFCGNIKAAGVGITLTSAEVVIFNDLSFVPSDHSQAEDRAYRYGQKNSVLVYYPLFENTIEGAIYDILIRKKGIFETVMGDNLDRGSIAELILNSINGHE